VCPVADEGSEQLSVDLLTCGNCRQQFPLAQFLQFVWHKVIGCDNRRPGRRDVIDDVTADRAYDDVTNSPQQQPPPHREDDVSSVTSRAGAGLAGKFHAASS